jgi:preprotein translocase subunit SecE
MSKAAVMEENEQGTAVQRATAGPERLMQFFRDTRQEMHKVVTPTRAEVRSTTSVVIVTVFIFAAYFALVDAVIGKGIDKVLLALTKH